MRGFCRARPTLSTICTVSTCDGICEQPATRPEMGAHPKGVGPEQVVFYGRGRLGRRWFPKPVQMGSIPVVRAIHALSNSNDAAPPEDSSPLCGVISSITNNPRGVMIIRIPIPRGVGLGDFDRLRSHAAWYRRQVLRHGPGYGAKRRARSIRRSSQPTTSRIGPVL